MIPGALPAARVSAWKRAEVRRAAEEAEEGAVGGGARPEHPEHERREERRVHEAEDELHHVHRVRVIAREVGAGDAEEYAHHGDRAPHPEVVLVGLLRGEVGLVEVVGPDRVEGGHVAGHARHERGEEGGEREAEQTRGAVLLDEREDHAVVVDLGDAVLDAVLEGVVVERRHVPEERSRPSSRPASSRPPRSPCRRRLRRRGSRWPSPSPRRRCRRSS